MRKALVVSVVLHIAVFATLLVREMARYSNTDTAFAPPAGGGKKSIQVKTLSEQEFQKKLNHALGEDKKMQIVQSDDQLKSAEAPDVNGREKVFLSKNNQTADKNTRAPRVGKFKNVLNEGVHNSGTAANRPASDDKVTKTAKKEPPPKPVTARDLFNLAPSSKDLEQKNALASKTGRLRSPASIQPSNEAGKAKVGDGLSATDDYLQDVAIGANTILNTKEYKFYSFYERIREKLAYQWHSRLDQEVQTILGSGQAITSDQRTKIEVHLDKGGQVVSVKIIHSSGYNGLDRAATQAFYMAAPFPNPPQGMIGDNNEVSLSWDFIVVAQAEGVHIDVRQAGF